MEKIIQLRPGFYNSAERRRDGSIGHAWLLLRHICNTFKLSISIGITSSVAIGEKICICDISTQNCSSLSNLKIQRCFELLTLGLEVFKWSCWDLRPWHWFVSSMFTYAVLLMIHLSWVCAYWRMMRDVHPGSTATQLSNSPTNNSSNYWSVVGARERKGPCS